MEPFVHAIAMKIMPPRTRGERENSRIFFPVILPSRIEFAGFSCAAGKNSGLVFCFSPCLKNIFFGVFFRVVESYVGTNFQPGNAGREAPKDGCFAHLSWSRHSRRYLASKARNRSGEARRSAPDFFPEDGCF
jgi:hypothetical protein